ncbi:hypothetical protein B1813_16305 [Saccharomonospora piscinae]|uniref:Excreted virulence factor EspC, type VII ESX diderm n=1 Tax=Saccharomonospora piscinae TaxID=687388 RepID=A0A1V9A277_SACPI|nr:type VII secretion target [Saccharomonospora piscinae]OQO91054.1 hypothetical protein B1813_16305 [Saccharomonospora piscinae]TLW93752.1 hypothetical protein FFT09_10345 [Saccharomonospora piscinae]
MSGFNVNPDALEAYSEKLAGDKAAVTDVSGLVREADVGDESWGIVGLFVKQSYSEMLGDLTSLMSDMENGLQSASDKFRAAAGRYRSTDEAHQRVLRDIARELHSTAIRDIRA